MARLKERILGVVGDAAQNSPLPHRLLLLPNPNPTYRIEAGSFYLINHSNLPNDAPSILFSLRAVMVSTKNEHSVTIRYPSIQSLQAFFAKSDRLAIRSILYPSTNERYVMRLKLALDVLGPKIPSREFQEHRHSKSFWLINCFNAPPLDLVPSLPAAPDSNAKDGTYPSMLQRTGINCFKTQPLGSAASVNGGPDAPDSNAKNGTCLSLLQRSGVNWGSRQIQVVQSCIKSQPQPDDADEAVSALAPEEDDKDVVKEEEIHEVEVKLEETPEVKPKVIIQYSRKRKHGRPVRSQYKKIKCNLKQKSLEMIPKVEAGMGRRVDRWSSVRYETAVRELVQVLKSNKALYGHPITRATLREEARKRIGDTGLLDHLLKHMAGKVVPSGGDDRLRRKCDAEGKMNYWLESADLVNIREEAGVKDPYWTPPPGWKPGDCIISHNCICCKEVRLLRDELDNLRGTLPELECKDKKQEANTVVLPESISSAGRFNIANLNVKNSEESYELLVKKKSAMEQQLHEMSKTMMELEEYMKKLSSKAEVEANREPLRISYFKTSTEDVAEESSEESSEDDDEDLKSKNQVSKILRPIRLRACRLNRTNNMSNITTSRAADCAREDLMTVTPLSASPHSTTTS